MNKTIWFKFKKNDWFLVALVIILSGNFVLKNEETAISAKWEDASGGKQILDDVIVKSKSNNSDEYKVLSVVDDDKVYERLL